MLKTSRLKISTKGNGDIVDITSKVREEVEGSGIREGVVFIFCIGSTCCLSTIENEPRLLDDFRRVMEEVVPRGRGYGHDSVWGEGNAHSHIRSSIIGPSLFVPISGGRLDIGTWQQIVLIDFDTRPRSREVVLKIMGE